MRLLIELESHHSHDTYQHKVYSPEELERGRDLFNRLVGVGERGVSNTAIVFLRRALVENVWIFRFVFLWISLEALFGPSSAGETTYRLCQRIALFLAERGEHAHRNLSTTLRHSPLQFTEQYLLSLS